MITNVYEDTYSSIETAKNHTADLVPLADLLMKADHPMTCKEIGFAMFGDAYEYTDDFSHNIRRKCLTSHITQMLRHLVRGGFIRREEIDGEPIEVEQEEYQRIDDYGQPQYIRVHDDEGNEYQMQNPKYNPCYGAGKWVKVKKTIIPKIRVYTWVA